MNPDEQVTQIVISKLVANSNKEHFFKLTKQMKNWLLTQDGFVSYEVYENDLYIADKIVYKNNESAIQINTLFIETAIAREMLTLVEPNYSAFKGTHIDV